MMCGVVFEGSGVMVVGLCKVGESIETGGVTSVS